MSYVKRIHLVIEEDRGMGAEVHSAHATEKEAERAAPSANYFIDYIDIPHSVWDKAEEKEVGRPINKGITFRGNVNRYEEGRDRAPTNGNW